MKFFVTHGQGLEPFVLNELTEKFSPQLLLSVNQDEKFSGKMLFNADPHQVPKTDSEIDSDITHHQLETSQLLLRNLKTVERLFGFVYSDRNVESTLLSKGSKSNLCLQALYNFVVEITPKISKTLEQLAEIQMAITDCEDKNLEQHEEEEKSNNDEVEGPTLKRRRKSVYSFRVDAKITGKYRRLLNTYQATRSIGAALLKNLPPPSSSSGSWEVDLRNAQMSITVYVTDEGFLCGVPFSQASGQSQTRSYSCPLSERTYLNKIPLRSTLAYSLASLVISEETKEEEQLLILDPMVGGSTIIIELVKNFPQVLLAFGIDNSRNQLEIASHNIEQAKVGKSIVTILSDSTKSLFPFRDNIVFDGVVCDLPFGKLHGTYESVVETLPLVFKNVDRVVKMNGNIVLLISLAMSTVMENIILQADLTWRLVIKYPVKLGELPAIIYHYKK